MQFLFFKILFIFRGKGREGGREGEKHQCMVASHVSPTGDLACNPGMCPDWESNQPPFALQAHAQSTELHQPGLNFLIEFYNLLKYSSQKNWYYLCLLIFASLNKFYLIFII